MKKANVQVKEYLHCEGITMARQVMFIRKKIERKGKKQYHWREIFEVRK